MKKQKVALALSSGGPRGFAYIGAIEELESRGYEITSVSGASAGSLVGGIYAAGGLPAFRDWLYGLDPVKVMTLMDFTPSKSFLVKGEKVIRAIRERVPDVNIEDMPIPFTAIATDLFTGEEVVFREGPLFKAIRASISIPSMFRPVKWKGRTLVDGGMVNTIPLNRIHRTEGDILVGFNVNEIDAEQIQEYLDRRKLIDDSETVLREEAIALLKDTLSAKSGERIAKLRQARNRSEQLLKERVVVERQSRLLASQGKELKVPMDADDNYYTIVRRSFGIMNGTIARQSLQMFPPDILVSMPYDSYGGVYGYSHAREIAEEGRRLMAEALDRYEQAHASGSR